MKKFFQLIAELFQNLDDWLARVYHTVLGWMRTDGMLHAMACALLLVLFAAFLPWWVAVIIVAVIGAVKELWDLKHVDETAEWHDVFCDLIGIGVGLLIVLLWYIFKL